MASTVEKTEKNKVKLTITVDAETFKQANQTAYMKNRGQINIPGFRKGKAPLPVIVQRYGEGVFYEDAFDEVFPQSYSAALEEHDVKPVEHPSLDILEIGAEGVKYTAEVTVMPEVKLGKYKGVKVEAAEYKVGAKEVNEEIEKEREKIARWVNVERAVKTGDKTTIDYKGFVGEDAFEGGEAQGHVLEIGSGSFIPGFEDQVVGMKPGEEKDIMVTFPEQYHSDELAGKEAKFEVKVHEIKEKELPELDDEFAKDVSEFDTLAEYKKDVKKKLTDAAKQRAESETDSSIFQKVVEGCEVEIPEPMITRETDYMINDMAQRMSYQGINLDDYMKITNTTMDMLREQYKSEAENRVKSQLVFEAIQKAEGLEVTDEDVDAELQEVAGDKSIEEVKKTLNESNINYLKEVALTKKTTKFLKDNAEIKAKQAKKKAPAKKAASDKKEAPAKKTTKKAEAKDEK